MSERFQKLYNLSAGLYFKNCPVIIEAGALLKDNKTNNVLVQLKLRNLSYKSVIACKVSVKAFEPNGKETEGVKSFSYLDIMIEKGSDFGSKIPIYLPNNISRKIIPAITEIVFEDGSVWSNVFEEWNSVPKHKKLATKLSNVELRNQYEIEVGIDCNYLPEVHDELFLCTCGVVNMAETGVCYNCQRTYDGLIKALNIDELTNKIKLRVEREKEEREAAKIKAEKDAVDKAKKEEERFDKLIKNGVKSLIFEILIACILIWIYFNM